MLIYINKTRVQKLAFLLILLTFLFCVLLFYQKYILSLVVFLSFIFIFRIWYLEIVEELIIYSLKKAQGEKDLDSIIDEYEKKGELALLRLSKKQIIEVDNRIVRLKDLNSDGRFTRRSPKV